MGYRDRTLQSCIDANEKLVVICLRHGCRHRAVIRPDELRDRGAPASATLWQTGRRMRCQKCKVRGASVEIADPPSPPPSWRSAFSRD